MKLAREKAAFYARVAARYDIPNYEATRLVRKALIETGLTDMQLENALRDRKGRFCQRIAAILTKSLDRIVGSEFAALTRPTVRSKLGRQLPRGTSQTGRTLKIGSHRNN